MTNNNLEPIAIEEQLMQEHFLILYLLELICQAKRLMSSSR